jgi:hypothetical protein
MDAFWGILDENEDGERILRYYKSKNRGDYSIR